MSKASWLVVVDACGAVIASAGGVPERWTRASAADLTEAAPAVAQAAHDVAADVRHGAPRARRHVALDEADVEILALPAIALSRAPCDIRAFVDRALAPFRAQAQGRDILLRVDDQIGEPLAVDVDAPKITWVVATLVGNALRFVRTGSRHLPGGTVIVRLRRAGERAFIEVEDDGPGIEPRHLARLFDPQTAEAGAAVALAMARDVAFAHGGALAVDSSTSPEAHGTVVRVELPLEVEVRD